MSAAPIISLRDVALHIGQDVLFEDVSLTLHEGAKYAFVGRNGSGKSTLLKLLGGVVEPETGERIPSKEHTIGWMEQDPDLSGFETLEDFAKSDLDLSESYRADIIAEGLKLDLGTSCQTASGGERRRAALTKIIAEAPDLMLLDEPTNHLDIDAILWLEQELAQTQSAYVIISHDRALLNKVTNTTLWLDRGVFRSLPKGFGHFEDWRDRVFEEEDQQRHKLNRLIKDEARWAVEGISARRKRNMGRMRRLGDLKDQRSAQIKRQGTAAMVLEAGPKSGKLVAEARGISHAFGDKQIVHELDLKIARGDRIALVGPNGAGKSTLLKLLTGQMAPDEGHIRLGTNLITAYFDQNREALDPEVSLWDTLTDDKSIGISGKNDQIMVRGAPRHVAGYLKEFLFTDNQLRSPVKVLSGGEKARLLLAKLMAKECNLLIMDEPTNDLDVESLDLLQEIIDQFDGTVMLVSHDRDFLDRVASKTLCFEGRGVVTPYAGGWSDMQSQRKEIAPSAVSKKGKQKQNVKHQREGREEGLSFTQKHRLEVLPSEMERLTAEIAKLEEFLADPELFTKEPVKFQKASEGLVERQEALASAEEEWLELAALAEG